MNRVFVIQAKRSPIGSFLGSLSSISPAQLTAAVIRELFTTIGSGSGSLVDHTDEVIVGHVLSAGHGQNVARQAAIQAGLAAEVPAYTVNMLCGSGMRSVMTAYAHIKAGLADVIVAGGVENMSQSPFLLPERVRSGHKMGALSMVDSLLHDGLTDAFHHYHMGVTAENIARRYCITREMQDQFAMRSQEKAIAAQDTDRFRDEIVPIEVVNRKGAIVVSEDEYLNRATSLDKLAQLRPAFEDAGTVTAGNASGLNDGASMLLLASEQAVRNYSLQPLAEIIAVGQGGVDPAVMGMGPVPAITDAFQSCGMTLDQMELIELNEAFAAQSLGVLEELKRQHYVSDAFFEERVNVNGGAIALGHPLGASGARIATTLVHEMMKREVTYGLATLCVGGGMGTAMIVKRIGG
ncbi:acetyl-CoA C-acetyltransferase [Paenibacillus arenosi]|uniref:acetyl-CoA C-acetyltransferase n=1 Tax=Paenibacillus arenosi TaxID=2774142 RepID=A0ABR9AUL2_9BACL|nr:acetyl-CoA C-acetyltransferase [Paenibacillus arenosi]MBD8497800.1 acetyl-CoA C-acetyltransferase [Paenibacillus arenosi]